MEPALRKLDQEYEGRAAIREINTSEYPELVPYFRIAAVPTQILFDKDGKELGWHQGYMDESSMRQAIEGALKAAEAKPDEAKAGSAPSSLCLSGREAEGRGQGTIEGAPDAESAPLRAFHRM